VNTKDDSIKIIELIGPAGSGKSTLAKALYQHKESKLISSPPNYRKVSDLPFFARNSINLLPLLIRISKFGKLSRRDFAWMVTLRGWSQELEKNKNQSSILILDEGPIYFMAYLQIYGSKIINSIAAEPWWDQMYKHWSRVLDIVIMLDAPNASLIDRIRGREKPHGVKVKPDDYAHKFLSDLREKYEYLLNKLTAEERGPKVLRFDTQQFSINKIESEVFDVIQTTGIYTN
jgi:thymidylate kinase